MNKPILVINEDCGQSVAQVIARFTESGLQVMQTFDLQTARLAHENCPCPHHGSVKCTCQMIILLVYDQINTPATLVCHGYEGQTWFYLVKNPKQLTSHHLELLITRIITPPTPLDGQETKPPHIADSG